MPKHATPDGRATRRQVRRLQIGLAINQLIFLAWLGLKITNADLPEIIDNQLFFLVFALPMIVLVWPIRRDEQLTAYMNSAVLSYLNIATGIGMLAYFARDPWSHKFWLFIGLFTIFSQYRINRALRSTTSHEAKNEPSTIKDDA